jgi:sigma-E factor negative regulatory protein RseB
MLNKRQLDKHGRSAFAWGLFALFMSAVAVAADEPREWLERMNNALTTRNYDGTFAHWQNGKVEMLRIIHRVKDGQTSERLVSLDGSGREFIRSGNELVCYLPDKRTVLVEKRPDRSPLLGNFPRFDAASTAYYDIKEVSRARIYRRDTRVISVTPKDDFRYGYKLWIDEGTAMPLRTQLCDARGRVIEQLVLAEDRTLRINTAIPDSAFLPEVSTEGFRWLRSDPGLSGRVVAGSRGPDRWNAESLPPGFRITLRSAQIMPGSSGPVAHLVFSDGLASVSVFVESQARVRVPPGAADKGAGAQSAESGEPDAGLSQFGSTSTFSTVVEGHKVTAVGEVPPETVRSIANSLRSAPSLSLQGPPPR